jgi:hypothetical protein
MEQLKSNSVKKGIHSFLLGLIILPKTRIRLPNTEKTYYVKTKYNRICIISDFKFVPDYYFIWCNVKHHYKVYIATIDTSVDVKVKSKYAMCTMKTKLDIMGFCNMYQFLYIHRANNRK